MVGVAEAAGGGTSRGALADVELGVAEVRAQLTSLRLSRYAAAMERHGYDDWTEIRAMGTSRLAKLIRTVGMAENHADRLRDAIAHSAAAAKEALALAPSPVADVSPSTVGGRKVEDVVEEAAEGEEEVRARAPSPAAGVSPATVGGKLRNGRSKRKAQVLGPGASSDTPTTRRLRGGR